MGAADAVPGVSGGTVAFMTGIYEELIHSIKQFNLQALRLLFQQGPVAAWQHVNGSFLFTLLAGILFSLLTLARVVLYLLAEHPILIWSFFFGLILASTWSVVRHIPKFNWNLGAVFLLGCVLAYQVTSLTPAVVEPQPLMIFVSGMIAICAMILPGISGSFILLLLGMYTPVLMALKGLELDFIALFVLGCMIGIISFSRLLSWAFKHYHAVTLALLGGFMLGSLNKVWPWKYTLSYSINRHGEEVPLVQKNILPESFLELTGQEPYTLAAIGLMSVGLVLVWVFDRR
ncbi:DUF368 domain-containing protein [Nitrincola tapanii]|uniref:DUF368 domain-containing protein n=2 Tax=Nitrincola tapanii TaxID=1708751 RepID=A0A5A9W410_9GAMM|nr:DUF368 domain-containing protein [Nitrincola tapanii]